MAMRIGATTRLAAALCLSMAACGTAGAGAWDFGTLSNDDALDLIDQLTPTGGSRALRRALVIALVSGAGLDAPEAAKALAAAEVVAAMRGHPAPKLGDDARLWARMHAAELDDALVAAALQAVDRVFRQSELRELMKDRNGVLSPEWQAAVRDLAERLSTPR